METYIRLIAVLIVGCRGVNVLLRAKPIRFVLQCCTFFLKKGKLIIWEGFGGLQKALCFNPIHTNIWHSFSLELLAALL